MMSCIRRVWAGAGAPDRPIRIREHPRASEIPRLPRKFRGNQRPEIVLRTTPSKHLRRVVWAVEAAGPRERGIVDWTGEMERRARRRGRARTRWGVSDGGAGRREESGSEGGRGGCSGGYGGSGCRQSGAL
ncbi:protein CLT1 chloroplastic [Prunus yedoensis var. nudiflora]|uniref:Protein CLT1 chloroplastic n=1 Tax=Prunus yedoensis var. nudiflora TaxID=2094558 RepID=A0A314YU51_PRUYE|nr:protein CLT1 chloroplastic [Prunus yedoensis var. nudiflora]